jgi:cob(I)alamin adenosyltransferase
MENEQNERKGLILVNTGNGKGKTTAAIGLLLRAWGRDMHVGGIQFLKSEDADYGEQRAFERIGIELAPMGDGCTWLSKDLEQTAARAVHAWNVAKQKIVSGAYDVFLLDEFTFPLHFGWLDVHEVVTWLRHHRPPSLHLVITGRHAPPELVAMADLVTEMSVVKHPYTDQGILAQRGIEF